MLFFIYSRKSVYTGKGESIENQIEMCRSYIHTKFPDTEDTQIRVYEDEGFSARDTARPQFQAMLRDIRLIKPDYIVCYRLDRISRNVSDFSAMIEELRSRDISFICIREEFDTSKPMGKAMMYIASVFAQLERETIAERVRDNMLLLARSGRWLGGTTPTGYTSEKVQEVIVDGRIKTSCRLKEDPVELRTVEKMFDTFLELRSIAGVSKYLIRENITSRNGTYYSIPGIKQILQNPVYCVADLDALAYFTKMQADVCFDKKDCSGKYGLLAYNKRDYRKKSAPRQSMDKWIIAVGRHRGRIPGEKWVAVQRIIGDNRSTEKRSTVHNDYSLLSGILYCSICGSRMFAKRRAGSSALQQFDYICASKLRGGSTLCPCQNINGPLADEKILHALMPYIHESDELYQKIEKLRRRLQVQPELSDSIDAQIRRCTDEMNNLVRLLSQQQMTSALYTHVSQRLEVLDKQLSQLKRERDHMHQNMDRNTDAQPFIYQLADTLSSLQNCVEHMSVYEKRTLLRLIVEKVVWDGKQMHVYLHDNAQNTSEISG